MQTSNPAPPHLALDRRDFLAAATGFAAAPFAGTAAAQGARAPNILFILTDQERFFRPGELPAGYELPAHAKLMKRGTTFVNPQR